MSAKTDTSDWQTRKVIDRYLGGETLKILAVELGVSQPTVKKWLKSFDVTIRKGNVRVEPYVISDEIVKRYINGETIKGLARELGYPTQIVSDGIREHGIDVHPGYKTETTIKQNNQIADLYRYGMKSGVIANLYETTVCHVRTVAKQHGLIINNKGNQVRIFSDVEIKLILAFRDLNYSQEKIANILNTSQSKISEILINHGLPTRQLTRGVVKNNDGYILESIEPDDPMFCMTQSNRYVLQHRLMMARLLNRPLKDSESVHHINGNKSDNRIENLQLRQGRHGKGVVYICLDCGSHNIGNEELE